MICPLCGGKTKTLDSRDKEGYTKRRRKCESCGYVFYTEELEVLGKRQRKTSGKKKIRVLNGNKLAYMGVQ